MNYRVLIGGDSPFFDKITELLAHASPDEVPSEFGLYRRTNQFFTGSNPKLELDYDASEHAVFKIISDEQALDCILARAKEVGLCTEHLHLAITGPPQINRYRPGDRIGWHVHTDSRYLKDAVLSVVVVLSDSSATCGSLQVMNGDNTIITLPTPVGSCTLMSANLRHRVSVSSHRTVIAFDLRPSHRF